MNKVWTMILLGGCLLLLAAPGCEAPPSEGELLARSYCGSCHLVPSPQDLPQQIWATDILPLMAAMQGLYTYQPREFYLGKEAEDLAEVFPLDERIDSLTYAKIAEYYLEEAPAQLPAGEQQQLLNLVQFDVQRIARAANDNVPLLATRIGFSSPTGEIWVGGVAGPLGSLRRYDGEHKGLRLDTLPSPLVDYFATSQSALTIGRLTPGDQRRGAIVQVGDSDDEVPGAWQKLRRPLALMPFAYRSDSSRSVVFAEHGHRRGALVAFGADFLPDTLAYGPGAQQLRLADMDGDGDDDLLVLFGQGAERISLFRGGTEGTREEVLLRFPPSYGSVDFEVFDFDGDGDQDIIYANGDNYDYLPVAKPYHGIRIFLNDEGAFTERYFFPLDGAYGVEVDDFDGDGDTDLAAIAYFVPVQDRALRSFVYLEQVGEFEFTAAGFVKEPDEYYLTLAKGDTDYDGDQDLLIGNFAGYLPDGMPAGQPSAGGETVYLFLENTQRE